MIEMDVPIRVANNPQLQDGVGTLIYTFHARERIVSSLTWAQVVDPFNGTTPHVELYVVVPGHESDPNYGFNLGADLATVGADVSGPVVAGHSTDDAITTSAPTFALLGGVQDVVIRDAGVKLYARLTTGLTTAPGARAVAPGATKGSAWLHLTLWSPGGAL